MTSNRKPNPWKLNTEEVKEIKDLNQNASEESIKKIKTEKVKDKRIQFEAKVLKVLSNTDLTREIEEKMKTTLTLVEKLKGNNDIDEGVKANMIIKKNEEIEDLKKELINKVGTSEDIEQIKVYLNKKQEQIKELIHRQNNGRRGKLSNYEKEISQKSKTEYEDKIKSLKMKLEKISDIDLKEGYEETIKILEQGKEQNFSEKTKSIKDTKANIEEGSKIYGKIEKKGLLKLGLEIKNNRFSSKINGEEIKDLSQIIESLNYHGEYSVNRHNGNTAIISLKRQEGKEIIVDINEMKVKYESGRIIKKIEIGGKIFLITRDNIIDSTTAEKINDERLELDEVKIGGDEGDEFVYSTYSPRHNEHITTIYDINNNCAELGKYKNKLNFDGEEKKNLKVILNDSDIIADDLLKGFIVGGMKTDLQKHVFGIINKNEIGEIIYLYGKDIFIKSANGDILVIARKGISESTGLYNLSKKQRIKENYIGELKSEINKFPIFFHHSSGQFGGTKVNKTHILTANNELQEIDGEEIGDILKDDNGEIKLISTKFLNTKGIANNLYEIDKNTQKIKEIKLNPKDGAYIKGIFSDFQSTEYFIFEINRNKPGNGYLLINKSGGTIDTTIYNNYKEKANGSVTFTTGGILGKKTSIIKK